LGGKVVFDFETQSIFEARKKSGIVPFSTGRQFSEAYEIILEGAVGLTETIELVFTFFTAVLVTVHVICGLEEEGIIPHKALRVLELAVKQHGKVTSGGTSHTLEGIRNLIDVGSEGVGELVDLCLKLSFKNHKGEISFRALELVGERDRGGLATCIGASGGSRAV
jgi:hypothetical protein